MADQVDALNSYVRSREKMAEEFTPCAYYGAEEDAMTFYFRNDAEYAKRINEWLTLYFSLDENHLVGCQIKGVRRVLEDLGCFGVSEPNVQTILATFLGTAPMYGELRQWFCELGLAATRSKPKLEMLEAV